MKPLSLTSVSVEESWWGELLVIGFLLALPNLAHRVIIRNVRGSAHSSITSSRQQVSVPYVQGLSGKGARRRYMHASIITKDHFQQRREPGKQTVKTQVHKKAISEGNSTPKLPTEGRAVERRGGIPSRHSLSAECVNLLAATHRVQKEGRGLREGWILNASETPQS